jgi:hypothetical protein
MKKLIVGLLLLFFTITPAFSGVTVKNGKFYFNGERQEFVWGRDSFKLANIITYHFVGKGNIYSLNDALEWIYFNQRLFGKHVVLRVFLETAGWSACDEENGIPENCMFGSEPRDQGFWNREKLRDGRREKQVHPVGKQVIEWFFKTSQETGVAFELVIDATLKHDDIPKGEIDHVIRQVGVFMGLMAEKYPLALIIPETRNEWNAHNQSGHTLHDVNMWVVRWHRDNYWTAYDAAVIVDGSSIAYQVGSGDGKYRAGMIHPRREGKWQRFPNDEELEKLRDDANGMPVGFNESMMYIEPEDKDRASQWYRSGGRTTDWDKYLKFLNHVEGRIDYFIIHDEKGVQCNKDWPRPMTRIDQWALNKFGGVCEELPECINTGGIWNEEICGCNCPGEKIFIEDKGCVDRPLPPPPPPPSYDHIINASYERILLRPADPKGLEVYNKWLAECYADIDGKACIAQFEDVLVKSNEYNNKFKN